MGTIFQVKMGQKGPSVWWERGRGSYQFEYYRDEWLVP